LRGGQTIRKRVEPIFGWLDASSLDAGPDDPCAHAIGQAQGQGQGQGAGGSAAG